ncbi:MAG: hypothetical protein UW23_C0026G0012, partial [Candidatus Collierbacteria bacterium GW2011_GWA1_44_12]
FDSDARDARNYGVRHALGSLVFPTHLKYGGFFMD